MPAKTLDTMKAEVREHGGRVQEGKVRVDLFSQGLLVRVSVYGTGIFDRRLSFEEIGISAKDPELAKYFRPGVKSYAPDYSSRLGSWGTMCRQAASKYALHLDSVDAITASRSWRFLHFDAYDDFKARWDELQNLRDDILRDLEYEHAQLVEDAVLFYTETLGDSFDRLQQRYRQDGGIAIRVKGLDGLDYAFGPDDRDYYLRWVEANVRADFPTMEAIRESVYAEYLVNFMFDSTSIEQAAADEAEARARQQQATTEAMELSERQWEMETTREARERAIRQAELERMRQRMEEIADPFAEAMDQLLRELSGHIRSLLEGLDRNGSFRGRSLDRVDNMIEMFRIMGGKNLEDPEIEHLLNELQARRQESPSDDQRDTWTTKIADDLSSLKRRVRDQSEVMERRLNAQTRAGALEL